MSNKAQSQELGSTCKVQKKSLLKIPVNHSKSVISSIIRPKSSALRSHLVCRPNTRNSSKIIKSHSFNGVNLTHDNCPMSPTSISTNARDHYDSKVSSLWEQAINSPNLDGSSAVTCQPGEYLKVIKTRFYTFIFRTIFIHLKFGLHTMFGKNARY